MSAKMEKSNFQLKLTLSIFLMCFQQLIIGCSYVFSSILLAQLREPKSTIKLSSDEASWIASIPILICPIALPVIGFLTDKFGRRKTLQLSYVPLILSWLILSMAYSYKTILVGRMILGIVLGSGTCVYVYIAEICPAEQRPFFSAMVSVFIGIGNIVESSLAVFFHWHTVSIGLAVASSVGCVLLFLVPEPPIWLRNRNQIDAAERSERWWFGADFGEQTKVTAVEVVSTVILPAAAPPEENPNATTAGGGPWWSMYAQPTVWKPALITLGFFICQQCSGLYVLLFYSADVLRDCKVPWDGVTVSVVLFGTRVISSVVYACLHRVKRKTLAVASCIGMAASLTTIIAYTKLFEGVDRPPFGIVLIVAFVVYVFSGQIGILPLPWVLCGEVFPMAVKGSMNGIVQTGGFLLMFSVIKIYPFMVSILGIQNIWTIFTFICLLSALFCLFILPETKGVPLDVILTYFESHKKATKISK